MSALDRAIAAMEAAPEDGRVRLRFWDNFVQAELFLLLREPAPPSGAIERLAPRIFALGDGPTAVAFDSEGRLADFGAGPHYASVSGRVLARIMAGQGVALGLNLGTETAGTVLPPEALDWLSEVLSAAPRQVTSAPVAVAPPENLPERLLTALDEKLPAMAGLAASACLATAVWGDGARRPLLLFVGPAPGAEPALAAAVGEALIFSGLDLADLDVGFTGEGEPLALRIAPVALRLAFAAPPATPAAPGSDPNRPPRLR